MNRANQYKKNQITTASRGQILIMLYEGAIQHVKKAILALQKKDLSIKGMAIGKAHDIINELNTSLNHEVGGQISKDLERLYAFMVEQLIKANIENDEKPLHQVQKILETLLDGWKGAVSQVNTQNAAPTPGINKGETPK